MLVCTIGHVTVLELVAYLLEYFQKALPDVEVGKTVIRQRHEPLLHDSQDAAVQKRYLQILPVGKIKKHALIYPLFP